MDFGTLAGGLGCFPLDYGAYPPQSDSHALVDGIRGLVGFSNLVRPLVHSVPYHHQEPRKASPKAISERTSYH